MSLPICEECDRNKAFPIRVGGLCAFCLNARAEKAEAELATSDRAVYAAEKLITREIGKPPQGRDWNKIHEAALVLRSYMFLKEQS